MSRTSHGTSFSEPTGASAAWTSDDAVVVRARALLGRGGFAEAEDLLGASVPADLEVRQARAELREIIRRIRWDYSQDEAQLLAAIRKSVPDAGADDLRQWREAGEVQHRRIDGRIACFNREPANIFRFCEEAKRRRRAASSPQSQPAFVLEKHLGDVIAAAQRSERALVLPMRHTSHYKLTINPGRAPVGATVRCWLPFPQEHQRQTDVELISSEPANGIIAPRGSVHRTLYLQQKAPDTGNPIVFKASWRHTAWAYYPMLSDAAAKPLPAGYSGGHAGERPPHIRFTPALREAVAAATNGDKNPLVAARRIFEWVFTNIRYCAEEEYSTIPSFSEKALRSRKGDCGIQSMLFIAMCRCAGIPARWQSGWESRPGLLNMHDWAEFYVQPWGWLPADPSFGLKESDDWKVRWFYFGHIDSYRMIVNTDYGYPLWPAKPSMRSEPADFQRGEVEVAGRNLYFDEWDYDMRFELEPAG